MNRGCGPRPRALSPDGPVVTPSGSIGSVIEQNQRMIRARHNSLDQTKKPKVGYGPDGEVVHPAGTVAPYATHPEVIDLTKPPIAQTDKEELLIAAPPIAVSGYQALPSTIPASMPAYSAIQSPPPAAQGCSVSVPAAPTNPSGQVNQPSSMSKWLIPVGLTLVAGGILWATLSMTGRKQK